MVWVLYDSIAVGDEFASSLPIPLTISGQFKIECNTSFPTLYRLLFGLTKDSTLTESLPCKIFYPAPYGQIFVPELPPAWDGNFTFYFRNFRSWADQDLLILNFFYWEP